MSEVNKNHPNYEEKFGRKQLLTNAMTAQHKPVLGPLKSGMVNGEAYGVKALPYGFTPVVKTSRMISVGGRAPQRRSTPGRKVTMVPVYKKIKMSFGVVNVLTKSKKRMVQTPIKGV